MLHRSLFVCLCSSAALAQTPGSDDVEALSLEALLETPVEVATGDARTTLEAPNVVVLLTRDELLASGARDLLEVLQLIPGFTFHQDVTGVVGVAFRSQWGHEGKVLVMLDGVELNELLYSTTQFGHHVLVQSIERLEVVRGPGSALYGGSAELAVINVVTRQGRTLRGGEVGGRLGGALDGLSDWSVAGSFGDRHEPSDVEWSVTAVTGEGRRSRATWTDALGRTTSLAREPLDPLLLTAGLSWKGLKARLLVDDERIGAASGYGQVSSSKAVSAFRNLAADVQGDFPVSARLSLRPRVQARLQTPWQTSEPTSDFFYDKSAARLLAGFGAAWTPLDNLLVSGSLDAFWDHAWLNDRRLLGFQTEFKGASSVSYSNVAAWLQAQWDNPWVNVTLGGRLEWNSAVGVNVAPRIALQKAVGRFNLKLLVAGAFRNPGIENLNLGTNVGPERTRVGEAEVGVALGELAYLSVNGFYTELLTPILYGVDPTSGEESYRNGGKVSTGGAEAMLRVRGRKGLLTVTGAFAMPFRVIDADTLLVPDTATPTLLAMPLLKLTAFGRFRFDEHFSAGGSAVFLSGRQAWTTPSEALDGTLVLGQVPAALLLSLWVGVEQLGLPGLSAQLGVGNLLDANVVFAQPYTGGIPPLPGRGRELFFRLSYAFGGAS